MYLADLGHTELLTEFLRPTCRISINMELLMEFMAAEFLESNSRVRLRRSVVIY